MARPIEYDPQEVLINAMHLFWEQGYEATSIQDVVKATGLKPGSLYNRYGNKEGIFEAVVNQYATSSLVHIDDILHQQANAFTNIEIFLQEIIIETISNEKTQGCLLVKTLLVLPNKDVHIQKHIVEFFDEIEELLAQTLQVAKTQGSTKVEPKSFAKFIVTAIFGLHAYHKTHQDKSVLEENVRHILACLKV